MKMKTINKILFGTKRAMLCIYDRDRLVHYPISKLRLTFLSIIILSAVSFASVIYGRYTEKDKMIKGLTEYEKLVIVKQADPFSKEALAAMLKELNVKYPHIVMAQSIIETGRWRSKVFLENNNLFGMKEANLRVSTSKGTQLNHAYYNHWRESVYDYAFYQCRYLGGINSEAEYYQYLDGSYAEASDYVAVIKKTVEAEGLKDLFN
jgi:hypothetical protein